MLNDDENLVKNYFVPKLEQENEISAIVDLMLELRDHITSQGCYFPPLTEVLTHYRNILKGDGVFIDDAIFDRLYAEFAKHEDFGSPTWVKEIKHKSKHKKDKKEIKIGSKTAVGFLKFCAGSLLCLVPVPIVQGAGATLAVIGLNDMVDGQREESDSKDADKRFDANRRVDTAIAN